MWWESNGERVLRGEEGFLSAECVDDFLEAICVRERAEYRVGLQIFDSLSYGQMIGALSLIAPVLLKRDVPRSELSAVTEGPVAGVFGHPLIKVEIGTAIGMLEW